MCSKGLWVACFVVLLAAGCGGGYTSAPTPGPLATLNTTVSGQYNLLLTSTNGHGTTSIYTNFMDSGATFSGGLKTLVCPSNNLSQCQGDDAQANPITLAGTVDGVNIKMTVSFPTSSGTDIVTLVGSASASGLFGNYTDSQGDTGTWTAQAAGSLAGSYTGSFNSTTHPLMVAPSISVTLTQDSSFNVQGSASITGSPCIVSLSLSGQAIGGAFNLTDATNQVQILALPSTQNLLFTYSFEPTAPHCAGDSGQGTLAAVSGPWDY